MKLYFYKSNIFRRPYFSRFSRTLDLSLSNADVWTTCFICCKWTISSEYVIMKRVVKVSWNLILCDKHSSFLITYCFTRAAKRSAHSLGRFSCAHCVPDCRSCCGFRARWPVGRIVAKLRSSFVESARNTDDLHVKLTSTLRVSSAVFVLVFSSTIFIDNIHLENKVNCLLFYFNFNKLLKLILFTFFVLLKI